MFNPKLLFSLAVGIAVDVRPAIYLGDASVTQPVVSLCNSEGVTIHDDDSLNICLTIHPIRGKAPSKSFKCTDLKYGRVSGDPGMFSLREDNDQCLLQLRAYANSAGISLQPLQFSYSMGPSPTDHSVEVGTIAVHLKWAQSNRPFGLLQSAAVSATLMSLLGLLVFAIIV
jgi:hypothetical protein